MIFSDCCGTLTPPIGIGKNYVKNIFTPKTRSGKSTLCMQKEANTIDLFLHEM